LKRPFSGYDGRKNVGFIKIKSEVIWSFLQYTRFCSNSTRIGIVVDVHWVGCVCNQSWHVRTCLSNSRHKLQVTAFAQLTIVGRGSNTCVYVIAIFMTCESTEQRIFITFCFKIGKTAMVTYQLLQQANGEDAMGRTQVFHCFRRFKEGENLRWKGPPLGMTVNVEKRGNDC